MNQQRLTVTILDDPRYTKIAPCGRLDSDTSPSFEEQVKEVLAHKPRNILLDLGQLDYISSAGVRVVTFTIKSARAYGGYVQVARMQPQIKKVFDIIGVVPPNQIFSSVEELDAYLDRMQNEQ